MWADASGTTYFHGPCFTSLAEISPSSVAPGRIFYKQEIFQSSIEDTNPLLSICGKCCVLEVNEFTRFRLTEVPENDVYVCESMYEEAGRQIKKLDGLKKMEHHDRQVHQEEVYYFLRPISLMKVDVEGNIIPEIEMPKLEVSASVVKIEPCQKMSVREKQVYEERAARMDEEKEAKLAAKEPALVKAENWIKSWNVKTEDKEDKSSFCTGSGGTNETTPKEVKKHNGDEDKLNATEYTPPIKRTCPDDIHCISTVPEVNTSYYYWSLFRRTTQSHFWTY